MDLCGKIDELLEKDCYVVDMFPHPVECRGNIESGILRWDSISSRAVRSGICIKNFSGSC